MHVSVRRCGPFLFLVGLMLAAFAGSAAAQETGKVEGRVTSDAGQPLAGAQIVVLGSRLGNITNQDGYYFINNIPAGLQDVQAQYIGYQAVTVRQQRVLAGQTTTLNFRLAQGAIAIEAISVVGERAPLVPRDQMSSKSIVTGEQVDQLPVDNTRRVITLQPGVVESNRSKGVSIRGGRSGEEAVYVDGVLIRNYNGGRSSGDYNLQVGTNSLSEADVLTGGFSAQYGEAQSGIINYVTKAGGRRWNGSGSIQTDEMFPKASSQGSNRLELSLGGPVFAGLSFFGAVTAQGNTFSNNGKLWNGMPMYYANGVDTVVTQPVASDVTGATDMQTVVIPKYQAYNQAGRQPLSNSDNYTLNGKLDYSYGSGSRLYVSADASRLQDRFGGISFDPLSNSGELSMNRAYVLGWTQNFVKSAEHALSLDFKVGYTQDTYLSGVLNHQWDIDNRNPFGGFTFSNFQFMVQPDCGGAVGCTTFPVDNTLLNMILANTATQTVNGVLRGSTPFSVERTDINGTQAFRLNPFGVQSGFGTGGTGGTFTYQLEKDLQFRGAVDWQANRYNRVKLGGDYTNIDVANAGIGYNSLFGANVYLEKPNRASLFAQDRIDLGDLVIEAGLRLDRFNANTSYPVIAGYTADTLPSGAPGWFNVGAQTQLSPRLGVSFPVTVNSTFRLSYGHFIQTPDLNQYFLGKNIDYFRYGNTNTNSSFGRPVQMPRTIAFEFGFRQLLGPDFVMDISAYNKDKRNDIARRKLSWPNPAIPGTSAYLNTTTNADFGTIRGVDLRFDRRFSRVLQTMLAYSFEDARNTGTDPTTYTGLYARLSSNAATILGLPPNPPNAMHTTEENRTHNITGTFNLTVPQDESSAPAALRNFGVFGTFRFASGLPYSKLTGVGQNILTGPPTNAGLSGSLADQEVETGRTPWIKQFDLRLTRGVKLGRMNAQVFLDGRNVLNFTNYNSVVLTTGGPTDQAIVNSFVSGYEVSVSGTALPRDIDLRSLASAGKGVSNLVNLVALQRTEALFGNGDKNFTVAEQATAFGAAVNLLNGLPGGLTGPGRSFRLGLDFTF